MEFSYPSERGREKKRGGGREKKRETENLNVTKHFKMQENCKDTAETAQIVQKNAETVAVISIVLNHT